MSFFIDTYRFGPVIIPDERFRATFENGIQPAGFSNTGMAYNDTDATLGSPLAGNFSMAGSGFANIIASKSFTVIDGTGYGYMLYSTSLLASSQGIFELFNDTTRLFRVRALSAGTIRIYKADGTTSHASSSGVLTANTPAHIWFTYLPGTGDNASVNIYHSADGIKPDFPTLSTSTLEATLNADKIKFPVLLGGTKCVWDNIIISSVNIGSNP